MVSKTNKSPRGMQHPDSSKLQRLPATAKQPRPSRRTSQSLPRGRPSQRLPVDELVRLLLPERDANDVLAIRAATFRLNATITRRINGITQTIPVVSLEVNLTIIAIAFGIFVLIQSGAIGSAIRLFATFFA